MTLGHAARRSAVQLGHRNTKSPSVITGRAKYAKSSTYVQYVAIVTCVQYFNGSWKMKWPLEDEYELQGHEIKLRLGKHSCHSQGPTCPHITPACTSERAEFSKTQEIYGKSAKTKSEGKIKPNIPFTEEDWKFLFEFYAIIYLLNMHDTTRRTSQNYSACSATMDFQSDIKGPANEHQNIIIYLFFMSKPK